MVLEDAFEGVSIGSRRVLTRPPSGSKPGGEGDGPSAEMEATFSGTFDGDVPTRFVKS